METQSLYVISKLKLTVFNFYVQDLQKFNLKFEYFTILNFFFNCDKYYDLFETISNLYWNWIRWILLFTWLYNILLIDHLKAIFKGFLQAYTCSYYLIRLKLILDKFVFALTDLNRNVYQYFILKRLQSSAGLSLLWMI